MNRTARIHRRLAIALAGVWLASLGLTVHSEWSGQLAYPGAGVSGAEGPDEHPRIFFVVPELREEPDATRAGDRLLSIGAWDLTGAGKLQTLVLLLSEHQGFELPVRVRRLDGDTLAIHRVVPVGYGLQAVASTTLYMLVALLLLWRVPTRGARFLALSLAAFAFANQSPWGTTPAVTALGLGLYVAGYALFAPLGFRALQTFPEATARTSAWAPVWPWAFLAYGLVEVSQLLGWPLPLPYGHPLDGVLQALTGLLFLVMIVNNYRHSPPRERRQLAWVVLGVWLAMLAPILGGMIQAGIGPREWIERVQVSSSLVLPVSLLIALTWYNLGDVNRLLSRAAAYGLLLMALVGAVYLGVPTAASALSPATGAEPATIQAFLSFALTGIALVAGARLPDWFERRLFPERFALERGIASLLEELSTSRSPRELAELLARRLDELLVPAGLAVFLPADDGLAPVAGTSAGAALSRSDASLRAICSEGAPVSGNRLQRLLEGRAADLLGGPDPQVLIPVKRGAEAMALIALGAKESGDVYTRQDLAHLAALGARVALELLRYETDEIVRSGQQMVDEIRREKLAAEGESRAKTRFLAAASHDLRQPLHALGLYVEALRERMGASEHADLVGQIDRSTATLSETIDALLDVSKLDAGVMEAHPTELEVGPLLERLADEVAPAAAEKSLGLRVVPTRLRVRSDPVLLARMLRNLLVNAVRYTEGGRVLVGCRRLGVDVSIEVWDTGPGIPEQDRERIFAEFTRGRAPAAAGTGLGLAIVRGMGELLDHPVSLSSEVGRGTVFRVRVPRARARAQADTVDTSRVAPLSGTIALLEDDASVRAGTMALLDRWGVQVIAAATSDELLAQLREPPGAIVADFDLGEGPDGLAAITRLREHFGTEIPAMIVTGTAAPGLPERCAELDIPLLSKPLRPAQLRAALSGLRSRSRSRA